MKFRLQTKYDVPHPLFQRVKSLANCCIVFIVDIRHDIPRVGMAIGSLCMCFTNQIWGNMENPDQLNSIISVNGISSIPRLYCGINIFSANIFYSVLLEQDRRVSINWDTHEIIYPVIIFLSYILSIPKYTITTIPKHDNGS